MLRIILLLDKALRVGNFANKNNLHPKMLTLDGTSFNHKHFNAFATSISMVSEASVFRRNRYVECNEKTPEASGIYFLLSSLSAKG
jgi:hypothetical protein